QLGVAVRGRDVDVVDAVLEQRLQRAVGVGLGDARKGSGAEDHAAGLVSGRAEGGAGDHASQVTASTSRRVSSSGVSATRGKIGRLNATEVLARRLRPRFLGMISALPLIWTGMIGTSATSASSATPARKLSGPAPRVPCG